MFNGNSVRFFLLPFLRVFGVRSMLYLERFYYGDKKTMFGMGIVNFVETMACLVSGDVGLLNAAVYGLYAIGWSSCVVFILLFVLGKKVAKTASLF